jgi:hypothetical protein
MDKQEILNAVVKAYLVDGQKPGYNEISGECVYRADNEGKCAIGTLLPDAMCTPEFLEQYNEGSNVANLCRHRPEVRELLGITEEEVKDYNVAYGSETERTAAPKLYFLSLLQAAHDGAAEDAHGDVTADESEGVKFLDLFRINVQARLYALAVKFGLEFNFA